MQKILLPINPEHVANIFNGTKHYEYRKVRCKRQNVEKMLIYSTSPVMLVVGEAHIDEIIEASPAAVWKQTRSLSGIKKAFFDMYYEGKEKAVAYKLSKVVQYDPPLTLDDFGIKYTPQSFVYL